jgi:hypothetical protein
MLLLQHHYLSQRYISPLFQSQILKSESKMRSVAILSLLLLTAAAAKNAIPSVWDGSCYYPVPDPGFRLDSYLGRWYQVAGTIAPFTRNCKCIYAQYALNVSPCYGRGQAHATFQLTLS